MKDPFDVNRIAGDIGKAGDIKIFDEAVANSNNTLIYKTSYLEKK